MEDFFQQVATGLYASADFGNLARLLHLCVEGCPSPCPTRGALGLFTTVMMDVLGDVAEEIVDVDPLEDVEIKRAYKNAFFRVWHLYNLEQQPMDDHPTPRNAQIRASAVSVVCEILELEPRFTGWRTPIDGVRSM
jgi:hypothetical protein